MYVEFPNRRVIVAGAARGIGRAVTQAFAERGARVWACDLLAQDIEPLAGARPGGGEVHPAYVDVTDAGSIERVVRRLRVTASSTFWSMSPAACAANRQNRSRGCRSRIGEKSSMPTSPERSCSPKRLRRR